MTIRLAAAVFASLATIVFSSTALAADDAAPEPDRVAKEPPRAKDFSLTIDPIRPLMGVGVVSGEARLGARRVFPGMRSMDIGGGGWIGAGQMGERDFNLEPIWGSCAGAAFSCKRATTLWLGAQVVVYPVGSFTHGLQVGAEASWFQVWTTEEQGQFGRMYGLPDRHLSGGALMGAAVLGYKYVTSFGLTFNPQLAGGPAISTSGDVVAIMPRIGVNVGWTF